MVKKFLNHCNLSLKNMELSYLPSYLKKSWKLFFRIFFKNTAPASSPSLATQNERRVPQILIPTLTIPSTPPQEHLSITRFIYTCIYTHNFWNFQKSVYILICTYTHLFLNKITSSLRNWLFQYCTRVHIATFFLVSQNMFFFRCRRPYQITVGDEVGYAKKVFLGTCCV